MDSYHLPIDASWNTADITVVATFVDDVLSVYEQGISRTKFIADYHAFTEVMPAVSEQKRFDRDFQKQTGYSIYRTTQFVKDSSQELVRK